MNQATQASATAVTAAVEARYRSSRMVSLDAFRGLTIALMVMVNDMGGPVNYHSLQHSKWNGWTLTDTVFPTFLWIVGIAITLSFAKRLSAGVSRSLLVAQVFRRSVLLYAIGLFIYMFPGFNFGTMRLMGVLQRIAICYLASSLIYLSAGIRAQIIWVIGLVSVYWVLMTLVPVPGYGPGNLSIEGNFAHYVDHMLLGAHNYAATKTWDPEGIVSTLPAIASTLFGLLAGELLRTKRELRGRVLWMSIIGAALLVGGLVCSHWLPINKKLWTPSFTLFMAGLDCIVLSAFIFFIDGLGWKRIVRPFVIFGMNAILIYVLSEIFATILDSHDAGVLSLHEWMYTNCFAPYATSALASAAYAAVYMLLMYLVAFVMYKKGWFVKI